MKFLDKATVIILVTLMLIFFYSGQATNSKDITPWIFIKEFSSVLAAFGTLVGGIAAVFAASLAYKTINSWKEQFAHSERYKAIVTLEKFYYKLLNDFENYKESTLWQQRIKNGTIVHDDLHKLANNFVLYKTNWDKSLREATMSFDFACTFCNEGEVNTIKNAIDITSGLMTQQILAISSSQITDNKVIFPSVTLERTLKTVSDNIKITLLNIRENK